MKINPNSYLDLMRLLRGTVFTNLKNKKIGDIGEEIAKVFLGQNGYTDIISLQNRSGNGIDIIAITNDGRLVFLEVKTTGVARINSFTKRQKNMTKFVEEILNDAASAQERYKNLDPAQVALAMQILRKYNLLKKRLQVSGLAIGVDLVNELLLIQPWRFN